MMNKEYITPRSTGGYRREGDGLIEATYILGRLPLKSSHETIEALFEFVSKIDEYEDFMLMGTPYCIDENEHISVSEINCYLQAIMNLPSEIIDAIDTEFLIVFAWRVWRAVVNSERNDRSK
jgi:hypothetical protein